jgi:amidase
MSDPDQLCRLPARSEARKLREGAVSAVELLEAYLARISRYNPTLNAVVSLDEERARKQALHADQELRRGTAVGPLHGVPMTLKDGHEVAGLRTTVGTAALDHVVATDSTVAARLRAAGAVIVGHTNVPPWLADHQTANPIFGRTNNPWDSSRTPGGSSGGAAAALASGMTPLEVGSDLNGSIRLPAHFCGVYGLKTTEHRVPLSGFLQPSEEAPRPVRVLSCLGPMARDLDDLALALRITSGPDGRDADVPPVPIPSVPRLPLRGLRVAIAPTLPGVRVAAGLRRQVERVADAVVRAGGRADERLPELDWKAAYATYEQLTLAVTGIFDPSSQLSDEQRSLAWYLEALDRRDRFIGQWQVFFDDVDALILPPAAVTAFTHRQQGDPLEVDREPITYWANARLLGIFNFAGLPSLVVPAGQDDDGLPIGLQIVGSAWSETRLIAIARALERAEVLPGFRFPPGY